MRQHNALEPEPEALAFSSPADAGEGDEMRLPHDINVSVTVTRPSGAVHVMPSVDLATSEAEAHLRLLRFHLPLWLDWGTLPDGVGEFIPLRMVAMYLIEP